MNRDGVPLLDYSQHSDMSRSTIRSDGRGLANMDSKPDLVDRSKSRKQSHLGLEIEVADIDFQFDLSVVKLLTVVARELLSKFGAAEAKTTQTSRESSVPAQAVVIKINNTKIQLREHVPESLRIPSSPHTTETSFSDFHDEDALLLLLLSGMDYSSASNADSTQQKISISKSSPEEPAPQSHERKIL